MSYMFFALLFFSAVAAFCFFLLASLFFCLITRASTTIYIHYEQHQQHKEQAQQIQKDQQEQHKQQKQQEQLYTKAKEEHN